MVVDSLKNSKLYEGLHKDFSKVFETFEKIAKGDITDKIELVPGCVWVNAPSTLKEAIKAEAYEAHRDFIDIHYIISGAEQFGYANTDKLITTKDYDKDNDYELLGGEGQLISLQAGDFCIVFPQDAHIPASEIIGDDKLVRAVAKIKL